MGSSEYRKCIAEQLEASARLKMQMAETCVEAIHETADCIIDGLRAGGKVLLCGNGGSAADSQHIAAEMVGRFQEHREGMPAIALTTDTSILTSVANDYGFNDIFRRQVEALGNAGDVLIGISTSGKSENVVMAMEQAKRMGMKRIALTGKKDGPVSRLADVTIHVPSDVTARIQEGHITVGHILCDLAEKAFMKHQTPDK